jgi:hypothetical protein
LCGVNQKKIYPEEEQTNGLIMRILIQRNNGVSQYKDPNDKKSNNIPKPLWLRCSQSGFIMFDDYRPQLKLKRKYGKLKNFWFG